MKSPFPHLPKLRKALKQVGDAKHMLVLAKSAAPATEKDFDIGVTDLLRRAESLEFDISSLVGILAAQANQLEKGDVLTIASVNAVNPQNCQSNECADAEAPTAEFPAPFPGERL